MEGISTDVLIEEFKKDNPLLLEGLSDIEIKEIISNPFTHLKKTMAKGDLLKVRIQYMGLFCVPKHVAKGNLNVAKDLYNRDKITEKKFNEIENNILKYLEKFE